MRVTNYFLYLISWDYYWPKVHFKQLRGNISLYCVIIYSSFAVSNTKLVLRCTMVHLIIVLNCDKMFRTIFLELGIIFRLVFPFRILLDDENFIIYLCLSYYQKLSTNEIKIGPGWWKLIWEVRTALDSQWAIHFCPREV